MDEICGTCTRLYIVPGACWACSIPASEQIVCWLVCPNAVLQMFSSRKLCASRFHLHASSKCSCSRDVLLDHDTDTMDRAPQETMIFIFNGSTASAIVAQPSSRQDARPLCRVACVLISHQRHRWMFNSSSRCLPCSKWYGVYHRDLATATTSAAQMDSNSTRQPPLLPKSGMDMSCNAWRSTS